MINILDSSSQRIIHVLSTLLDGNKDFTIKELAETLDISEKTLHKDLKTIELISSKNLAPIVNTNNKLRILNLNTSNFLKLQSWILLNSLPIQFIKSIFYHPFNDLNFYAEKLHVSRSTLYRHVTELNKHLNIYNITIENQQSLFFINSESEIALRNFFLLCS